MRKQTLKYIMLSLTVVMGIACIDVGSETGFIKSKSLDAAKSESKNIKKNIAGLPVHFKGSDYVIHPIGQYRLKQRGKISQDFGSSEVYDANVADEYIYGVSGDMNNLVFQHFDSTSITRLTNKSIRINSFNFLQDAKYKGRKGVLIYQTAENGAKNKKRGSKDFTSFYVSEVDGSNFQKLTQDNQYLLDWKFVEIQNRLYFRAIEDVDNNKELDSFDELNYYYLDFDDKGFHVKKYNPLG